MFERQSCTRQRIGVVGPLGKKRYCCLLCWLDSVLSTEPRRKNAADVLFKRLLRANPVRADSLQDYALFLETRKEDYDTAGVAERRALQHC